MLYLATDHRGLKRKNQLKTWLTTKKIPFKDLGAYEYNADDDYPDYAYKVAQKVLEDKKGKGVVFCGSGAGICVAANKVKGIRCSLGFNHQQVKSFVEDDDINVLAIAADYTTKFKVFQLVKTFLAAEFKNEKRHIRRLEKIMQLEK
ncbi:MAG: RpiB/LacA/LacB family sugar-phosphate isomerase [Patescibacteria group bacterium]|jgi:ribose 5-phosphate isomerase B